MSDPRGLGEFEQLVILAILRTGAHAYGVRIRSEIVERTGRDVTPGALYTTLQRLEEKGLLRSRLGEPTRERGGRAKRFYAVTASGARALDRAQRALQSMMEGLELLGGSHG